MKINVIICDNEIQEGLKTELDKYSQGKKLEFEIESYQDSVEFMKRIESETNFDLVFLDIGMPGFNGFDIAGKIRDIWGDQVIIIFLTSMEWIVYDAFQYYPLRFIPKIEINHVLREALDAAIQNLKVKYKEDYIIIKSDYEMKKLYQRDICYFEMVGRKIEIHMKGGKVLHTNHTIKAFYEAFDQNYFSWIHNGCVVNLQYINAIHKYDVELDDGTRISLSRSRKKEIKREFARYWSGKI